MPRTSYLPNRFERKYVVPESTADEIRALIRPHVRPDEFLTPDRPVGYPVYSLYLDSPRLGLYTATASGEKNRFKLRIRFYDESGDGPIFAEIKRRVDSVIMKQRAGVRRERLGDLLRGVVPPRHELLNATSEFAEADEFCRLTRALAAVPTLIVGYDREAYLDTRTGTGRVTFDRNLRARPFDPARGLTTDLPAARHQDPGVILEMKYVDRLPQWMQAVILRFGLQRQSVPKYGWSVESLGEVVVRRYALAGIAGGGDRPAPGGIVVTSPLYGWKRGGPFRRAGGAVS